ncbi:MAG TPA: methyl-accepting chemotaxis protein [Blastocatellia bacterium]|nr:methyl-accepting chemotaxis protein [Blastocatellia bacterium]
MKTKKSAKPARRVGARKLDLLYLMNRLGIKTVRHKLIVGGLFLTGLSILLTCFIAYRSFYTAIDSSDHLRKLAVSTADTVDMLILENIQYVRSIASDPAIMAKAEWSAQEAEKQLNMRARPTPSQITTLEGRFKEKHTLDPRVTETTTLLDARSNLKGVFDRLLFTDRYGLTVGYTKATEDFVQSDEDWWQQAMKTGLALSEANIDKVTQSLSMEVCVAIPHPKTGQANGVLKVKYNMRDAQNYISRFKEYETGYAYAVNQDGVIVLHPNELKRTQRLDETLRTKLMQARNDSFGRIVPYNDPGGDTRLLSFAQSQGASTGTLQYPGFGWTFVVDNSQSEVYRPAAVMLQTILIWGVGLFLAFGALAILLARRLSGAIQSLYHTTERVSAGDLQARTYITTGDELEMVGEGFNQMMDKLAETMRRETEQKKELEKSLAEFLKVVKPVSHGDLTQRAREGDDPVGRIARIVNKMFDDFSAMIVQVKRMGLSVSSSATEILAAAEQIAAGAQRQAEEITKNSSAVEEMAASMTQVSRNSELSAEAARRALGRAEHGDRAMADTAEAMRRINAAVQQTSGKMHSLGARSHEISEIITLIEEIAAQTNLLSLNAAIEAAHAGEAGAGFSVVADEIRRLAQRSSKATKDVGNLIKAIQTETTQAITAMESGLVEANNGSVLADQASHALQDMSAAVRESSELMQEISAASEEQARVTRDLAMAMQTISSITLETTAGTHETAQTIQSMVGQVEELNVALGGLQIKEGAQAAAATDALPKAPPPGAAGPASFFGFQQGD